MDELKYKEIIVGKPFNIFEGRRTKGETTCIMEQLWDGSFILVTYIPNIELGEIIVLQKATIKVRVIKETDDFVMTLIKYGRDSLYFELVFDPTLYNDGRRDIFKKSNMLKIISIDSNTNIVKAVREISMPLQLHGTYIQAWEKAMQRPDFSRKYNNWVNDLDSRYTIYELWKMGRNFGEMGQSEQIIK